MTDLELVADISRKLERLLKEELGANGKGLGEQVRSVQHRLPQCLVQGIIYIAGIRNKVIHENATIHSRDTFEKRCDEILQDLELIISLTKGRPQPESTTIWKPQLEPDGYIENIWCEYDADNDEGIGMRIHSRFTVQNLKGERCRAVAWFYFDSGEQLRDYNNKFLTVDGYVSVGKDFTPPYDDTVYSNFSLFIPYDELHLVEGQHNLMLKIGLFKGNLKFATSEEQLFCLDI